MQFRSLLVVACALALSVTKAAAVPEPEIGRTDIRFYQVAEGFLPIVVDANGFPRGSGFARPNRWGQYTAYLMATNAEGQRTWRVEHLSPAPPGSTVGQASTMYLVEGRDRALLIDTASPATHQLGVNDLKTVVRHLLSHENTGRRRARPLDFVVANTHSHPDHIGENALMADRTIYYPDGDWPQDAPANYVPVREGGGATDHGVAAATIDLGGRVLEAIDMPPHTDGSTGYLDRANKLLFTGDAIGSAWPFLQAASIDVYARMARHLEEVTRSIPDIVILPAHYYQITAWGRDAAPISGRPLDRQYVLDQLALSEAILRGELDGEPFFWNPGTYWAGLGSARLVYALDRVTTTGANDIASYHAARLRTGYARAWARGLPVASQSVLRTGEIGADVFLIRQTGGPSLYLIRGDESALLIGAGAGAPGLVAIVDRLRAGRPLDVALLDSTEEQTGGLAQLSYRTLYAAERMRGARVLADGETITLGRDSRGRALVLEAQGFRIGASTRLTLNIVEDGIMFAGDALGRRTGPPGFAPGELVPFDVADPAAFSIALSDWSSRTYGRYDVMYSTGSSEWLTSPQYVFALGRSLGAALGANAEGVVVSEDAQGGRVFRATGPQPAAIRVRP